MVVLTEKAVYYLNTSRIDYIKGYVRQKGGRWEEVLHLKIGDSAFEFVVDEVESEEKAREDVLSIIKALVSEKETTAKEV
ncbi:MAG: hypothetical protein QXG57_06175 [Thermofilaceae archaeon]